MRGGGERAGVGGGKTVTYARTGGGEGGGGVKRGEICKSEKKRKSEKMGKFGAVSRERGGCGGSLGARKMRGLLLFHFGRENRRRTKKAGT